MDRGLRCNDAGLRLCLRRRIASSSGLTTSCVWMSRRGIDRDGAMGRPGMATCLVALLRCVGHFRSLGWLIRLLVY